MEKELPDERVAKMNEMIREKGSKAPNYNTFRSKWKPGIKIELVVKIFIAFFFFIFTCVRSSCCVLLKGD